MLHAELAATLGPERFQREIELAARLQHPHVLTVHDSGEVPAPAGAPPILWFTMPFVDAARRILLGLAWAYMGRKAEAVREGERAVAFSPIGREAYQGAYFMHQLARIYTLVGEPDRAIDLLERLLAMPYYLSPVWLRIDPTLDPLRKHPRFQRLVEQVPTS
ncbi:MAG: TPR end-of-group domain-containing protein [Gemmatimonadales bacterium]